MVCRAPTSATLCGGQNTTGAQLRYDAEERLASWQNAPTNPTTTASYLYGGSGERVTHTPFILWFHYAFPRITRRAERSAGRVPPRRGYARNPSERDTYCSGNAISGLDGATIIAIDDRHR